MTTKYLVYSWTHGLVPFAHRLRREDRDVEVIVHKPWYERAWDGQFTKVLRHSDGSLDADNLGPALEEARAGRVTVLSDNTELTDSLGFLPNHFPRLNTRPHRLPVGDTRLGAWFDGDKSVLPHLLMVDVGLWPGGLGPYTPGGMTLVRLDPGGSARDWALGFLKETEDELRGRSFKGLYQVGLNIDQGTGELIEEGLAAGWPYLHAHAFVSELEGFGVLLAGGEATLGTKYTTVLPVTTPPWPTRQRDVEEADRAPQVAVEGLDPHQLGRLFWHDVTIDQGKSELRTAGLDGFVAVARGGHDSLSQALVRAREVAGLVQLPQKQWRPDVGGTVDRVLLGLERRYGLTP